MERSKRFKPIGRVVNGLHPIRAILERLLKPYLSASQTFMIFSLQLKYPI